MRRLEPETDEHEQELDSLKLTRCEPGLYAGTVRDRRIEYRRERIRDRAFWNVVVDGVFVSCDQSLDDCRYTAQDFIAGKLGTARFEKRRVLRKYNANVFPAYGRWEFELAIGTSTASTARDAWNERLRKDGDSLAEPEHIVDFLPFEATRAELKKYQWHDRYPSEWKSWNHPGQRSDGRTAAGAGAVAPLGHDQRRAEDAAHPGATQNAARSPVGRLVIFVLLLLSACLVWFSW